MKTLSVCFLCLWRKPWWCLIVSVTPDWPGQTELMHPRANRPAGYQIGDKDKEHKQGRTRAWGLGRSEKSKQLVHERVTSHRATNEGQTLTTLVFLQSEDWRVGSTVRQEYLVGIVVRPFCELSRNWNYRISNISFDPCEGKFVSHLLQFLHEAMQRRKGYPLTCIVTTPHPFTML